MSCHFVIIHHHNSQKNKPLSNQESNGIRGAVLQLSVTLSLPPANILYCVSSALFSLTTIRAEESIQKVAKHLSGRAFPGQNILDLVC
jgi:hypothetical protein